jgi:hypothetical protein
MFMKNKVSPIRIIGVKVAKFENVEVMNKFKQRCSGYKKFEVLLYLGGAEYEVVNRTRTHKALRLRFATSSTILVKLS